MFDWWRPIIGTLEIRGSPSLSMSLCCHHQETLSLWRMTVAKLFSSKIVCDWSFKLHNGYQHRNINAKVCSVFHVQCLPLKHWESENPIHLVLHTYPRRQLGLASDPFFLESTWDVLYEGDGISDMPTKGDPSNQSCWALTNLYKASAPTSLWRSNGNPVPNDLPQLP